MNRNLARRLAAVEARLQPSEPKLGDLLTAEEEGHLWKLAREGSPDAPIRATLAGDARGAAILAKLDVRPRPCCAFVLDLFPYELDL